ncbi:MAG: SDR family NAD(P)-dependent oxidoreductase [Gammaproteobacteria bacterium]|nr:SDR family NAD(P)-dependent oxidoreductase [Gammaproteobacteria bacterium]
MTYNLKMVEEFEVNRSAEEVFDYIVDFSRIAEWDPTVTDSRKVSDGSVGQGTKFEVMYSLGLRNIPIYYTIDSYQAPNTAVLTGKAKSFTAIDSLTIEPTSSGAHVKWQADIVLNGTASLIAPLFKGHIRKMGSVSIESLRKALEDNEKSPTLSVIKKAADKAILPGLANFTKFGYQYARKSWKPVTRSIKGKHIVLTGATSGLGLASAFELAHRGASLTLVARNLQKAAQVVTKIKQRSGNDDIEVEIAELSEPSEVVRLANRLLNKSRPIDVLINNAGALLNPRQENHDGIETSFALLLLGPIILTEKLKPLLREAGTLDDPARIINVSSGGMYAKRISVSNIESVKGKYSGADAYARAKRGLVLAGEYWSKAWCNDNIVVQNMHPGWAKTPGVEVSLPDFNKKMQRTLRTPEQGADTIIWLACASEAVQKGGQFWLDREPHTTHLTNKTKENPENRIALFNSLKEYALRYDVEIELGDYTKGIG